LYKNLENDEVFTKNEKVTWKCLNCGYLHEDNKALDECPACLHPQAYFQIKENNY
jgi:rubrerythrin